jgi:hypothetical protein
MKRFSPCKGAVKLMMESIVSICLKGYFGAVQSQKLLLQTKLGQDTSYPALVRAPSLTYTFKEF